jgi:uncharacterized protein (DUF2062 family)
LGFLKQGIVPEKLSLALTLGLCIGIIPLMGINAILLTLLALIFRLNIPAIQLVNLAVYVFQIMLYLPFLKLGQLIFFEQSTDIILNSLTSQPQKAFWNTIIELSYLHLAGIAVWAIIALPLGFLIYYRSLVFFKKQKIKSQQLNVG